MKFIKINSIIYDYSEYKLNIINLRKIINDEIENSMARLGFVKQKENLFYNKKYDLMIFLSIKNRKKLKFV